MTSKTLTVISWTGRAIGALCLAIVSLSCVPFSLPCMLLALGIFLLPPRGLFQNRCLAQIALLLSLLPAGAFVCLVVSLLSYNSFANFLFGDPVGVVLFGIMAVGLAALPVALLVEDASAQKNQSKPNDQQVPP